MPKIAYEVVGMKDATLAVIVQANQIIDEYAALGYTLTLRQLYYQFVSRDYIPNTAREYNRLGNIVSKGRRAGLIDWSAIVDRTRNLQDLSKWESPADIVQAVAEQFRFDRWLTQPTYIEVWFEKDALMGVFERVAHKWRLPFFSCRGYTSDSEIWGAAQRLRHVSVGTKPKGVGRINPGRDILILHFGDHDPSGIDMTRDIRDRLVLFGARSVEVRRLALNMPQIDRYKPPPNPAKETDSRFNDYQFKYGDESWELDALDPTVLADLVEREVMKELDVDAWNSVLRAEQEARTELGLVSDAYTTVAQDLRKEMPDDFAGNLAALIDEEPPVEPSDDEDEEEEPDGDEEE
jgi:hypothetical protein